MAAKKNVATANANTAPVTAEVPDFLRAHMDDQRGNEEVTGKDLTIPRIEVVQGLSKCRKKSDPSYIEGAEEGMLYNNVTRELYGHAIQVVPVFYRKEWLLWRDFDLGGGFGGSYPDEITAKTALRDQEKPEEWEVVDTNQHFVIIIREDGTREDAVISMAKAKAKVSRNWNSLVRINGGPRFSRVYEISGVPDTNKKGQDFSNLSVRNVGFVDLPTFQYAEKIYDMVKAGGIKIDQSDMDDGLGEGTTYDADESGM